MRTSFLWAITQRVPTFRDNLSVPNSRIKTLLDPLSSETDSISRNVGNELNTLRNIPEQRSSGLLWFRMRSKKRHETSRSINDIARLSVILFPNNSAHVNCLINKFGQYYTIILLLRATALTDTTLTNTIIYNKPTRCNSGSIVFINNYKYALHVSDAPCVHHQEHYKL